MSKKLLFIAVMALSCLFISCKKVIKTEITTFEALCVLSRRGTTEAEYKMSSEDYGNFSLCYANNWKQTYDTNKKYLMRAEIVYYDNCSISIKNPLILYQVGE